MYRATGAICARQTAPPIKKLSPIITPIDVVWWHHNLQRKTLINFNRGETTPQKWSHFLWWGDLKKKKKSQQCSAKAPPGTEPGEEMPMYVASCAVRGAESTDVNGRRVTSDLSRVYYNGLLTLPQSPLTPSTLSRPRPASFFIPGLIGLLLQHIHSLLIMLVLICLNYVIKIWLQSVNIMKVQWKWIGLSNGFSGPVGPAAHVHVHVYLIQTDV